MHVPQSSGLLHALGAGLLLASWSCRASAQGPDLLPTIDEGSVPEAPEAPVASPPAQPPTSPAPDRISPEEAPLNPPPREGSIQLAVPPLPRSALPIRAQRRIALLGEVGWNGIAGFGPNLVFHAHPHLSFDMGAGLSFLGWKVGLRTRYNFLRGPVTPFLGVGVMGTAGLGDSPIPINDDENKDPEHTVNIKVSPAAFLQTVAGIDWIAPSGFTLVGAIGYAYLLTDDPVSIISGVPTANEERAFDVLFRSAPVITVALGYSFR